MHHVYLLHPDKMVTDLLSPSSTAKMLQGAIKPRASSQRARVFHKSLKNSTKHHASQRPKMTEHLENHLSLGLFNLVYIGGLHAAKPMIPGDHLIWPVLYYSKIGQFKKVVGQSVKNKNL